MSQFSGSAYHRSAPSRAIPGTLTVGANGVQFTGGDQSVTLPLSGLNLRVGGHNNGQVFFEHAGFPDWSLATSQMEILSAPPLANDPRLSSQLRTVRKQRSAWSKALVACAVVLVGFVALLVLAWMQKDKLVRAVADRLPVEWEVKLGDNVFQSVEKGGKLVRDPLLEKQLAAVTERLLPAVTNRNYTFRFHILNDTNINAFAIPGGHVVVHTGLLKAAKTPEEIAGVLAHEIAHVTERHSMRNIISSVGIFALFQAMFGDATGVMAVVAQGSEFLLNQKYSRDFEREADDVGWQYLLDAEVDPAGMVAFFETLGKEQQQLAKHEASLSLISTHPATAERIARLNSRKDKLTGRTFRAISPARPTTDAPPR